MVSPVPNAKCNLLTYRSIWKGLLSLTTRQERNTRMTPLKTLLSTFVRSCVFTGLIVLILGALTMLPAVPTLAVRT